MSSKTLPELLRQGHRRIRDVLSEAVAGDDEKVLDGQARLSRVRRELRRHVEHEESGLLPLLADAGAAVRADERVINQDLVEIERAVRALKKYEYRSPGTEVVLRRLRDVLQRHLRVCEGRVLPWVEHHVPQDRLSETASQLSHTAMDKPVIDLERAV